MRPRRTWFSRATLGMRHVGGSEDNDLPYRIIKDMNPQSPVFGHPIIESVWEPTPEERLAIAAGQNIQLHIWAVKNDDGQMSQPPVSLAVTDTPLGKPPIFNEPIEGEHPKLLDKDEIDPEEL